MAILYVLLTVLAWGTWLTPSQNVRFSGQQVRTFYVAATNLLIAGIIAAPQLSKGVSGNVFWLPCVGGMIWAFGAWSALTATDKLGLARAYGIWAPLNIIVSVALGAVLFREFVSFNALTFALLSGSLALIIGGVLMIVLAKGRSEDKRDKSVMFAGLMSAISAGVFWGAYYIPVKVSLVSMWVAAFPLACGMFIGCLLIVLLSRQSLRLATRNDYMRATSSGVLWALGNYGMLLTVEALGAGRGFTISQLALVVNALCGIYLLKDPMPNTRPAHLTLIGCALATIGAICLGNLK